MNHRKTRSAANSVFSESEDESILIRPGAAPLRFSFLVDGASPSHPCARSGILHNRNTVSLLSRPSLQFTLNLASIL